jgi:uncharacterized protein YndB with AHSA1/START domain
VSASPFSIGTRVLGGGAVLLILFLVVGFVLPGTWSAQGSVQVDAPPEAVFPWLDSPRAWTRWTPWPDTGLIITGPAHGAGSVISWDNADLGDGRFEVVEADPPRTVRYRVEVQKRTMRTDGTLRIEPRDGGTFVRWQEQGDFGHNPLMGYWARFMRKAQSAEMLKDLTRLKSLVEEGADADEPADSLSAGPSDTTLLSDSTSLAGQITGSTTPAASPIR